jgi:hypothetical protein
MKVRNVNSYISDKSLDYEKQKLKSLEERLLSYQEELESQSKKQLEEQLTQFKKLELSKMRVEERKSLKARLEEQKADFEGRILALETKYVQDLENERNRLALKEQVFCAS